MLQPTTTLTHLKVLLVEDSADDAFLLERALTRGGLQVYLLRIETLDELRKALLSQTWDVLVTDHVLLGFSSLEVLELKHELGLDVPCLVLSGAIGEEMAVTLLKTGAADVVSKGNFARAPLVSRCAWWHTSGT